MTPRGGAWAGAALMCALLAAGVEAQRPVVGRGGAKPELRLDAIFARAEALHVGIGVAAPVGNYVRVAVIGAGGVANQEGDTAIGGTVEGGTVASARVDVLGRFVFDPLREHRWGPYAGAGLTVGWNQGREYREERDWRPRLLAVLGVEGPPRGSWAPAVEVGLGGGTRVSLLLRRARAGWR